MWNFLRKFGKWIVEGDPTTHGKKTDLNEPKVFPPETLLWEIAEFRPWRLKYSVEILNDNKTSVEFAWEMMRKDFLMTEATAAASVLKIHRNGGIIIRTRTMLEAEELVSKATLRLKDADFPLIIRAFSVENDA